MRRSTRSWFFETCVRDKSSHAIRITAQNKERTLPGSSTYHEIYSGRPLRTVKVSTANGQEEISDDDHQRLTFSLLCAILALLQNQEYFCSRLIDCWDISDIAHLAGLVVSSQPATPDRWHRRQHDGIGTTGGRPRTWAPEGRVMVVWQTVLVGFSRSSAFPFGSLSCSNSTQTNSVRTYVQCV